jgi:hypothetical protein
MMGIATLHPSYAPDFACHQTELRANWRISFGARNRAECLGNECSAVSRFLKTGFEIERHVFVSFKMLCAVPFFLSLIFVFAIAYFFKSVSAI